MRQGRHGAAAACFAADARVSRPQRRHVFSQRRQATERQERMTAYQIGVTFERKIQHYLQELGYFALRSPGSKSKIDVIAIKPHQVLFIQCKRDARLDPNEWNDLFAIASNCGAIPLIASKAFRKPILFEQLMAFKLGGGAQPKKVWLANGHV